MIGLSPLSTGHPLRFQPKWVRPSTGSYPRFSLPMDSSPGFASAASDSFAILKARFHCGSVQTLTSPLTATRWLILQKARRHTAGGLRLLVGARFQVLFHSPLGVLFTFPSRYWFAIGHRRVFSLGGWSPLLRAGFHVSGATRAPHRAGGGGSRTGPSPCLAGLSGPFRSRSPLSPRPGLRSPGRCGPTTPASQRLRAVTRTRVWAGCAFARRYSRNLV